MTEIRQTAADELLGQSQPPLVGVVSTVRSDGSPHAVPVWYRWDGQAVRIWTHETRAWVKNLQRDPRTAFSVQQPQRPYGAVILRGRAEVAIDDSELHHEIEQICRRYLRSDEIESYVSVWQHLRAIVSIVPSVVRSWSRGF